MLPQTKDVRRNILEVSHHSGHGHIPTCFSVVELMWAVYETIRHDPARPDWEDRDLFILSKGHASLAHFCVLARFGYFDIERIKTFGAFQSDFGCHADRFKVPGIEASTGSLGHGIGLAVGMALGFKIRKSGRRVFVLIGDGEANEGSVWEALMVAANLNLDNLTIIYDDNRSHGRGLQIVNPAEKFRAFGCETADVDGHDVEAIKRQLVVKDNRPRAVVARTVKGHGCALLENNQYEWHRKSPDKAQLETLLRELDEKTI